MLKIRPETPADYPEIYQLVKAAFEHAEHTNGDEQNLVERLRQSPYYIPELALLAELDGKIVGYIMFTTTRLGVATELVLAPLAVLPGFHKQGIGGELIKAGHCRAKALGYRYSLLIGHATYYPRFGYQRASNLGITCAMELPDECFMVFDLHNSGQLVNSELIFAKEFFE